MTSSANLSLGSSASPGDLELENIFEDRGVSWLIIDELFALELETYRRCFPAQPVSLHYRDATGASALTSCETSPLQPTCRLTGHSSPSSFWTRLTNGGPKEKTTTLTLSTSTPWQRQSFSISSCTQRDIQIRFQTNSQTLSNLLAHRPTCSQPLLHSSPGASPTTLHCCAQIGQFRKLSQRNILSCGQSTTSLAPTRQQLGSKSPSSASPCGVSSHLSCLSAHSFHWFLPTCLLGVLKILPT